MTHNHLKKRLDLAYYSLLIFLAVIFQSIDLVWYQKPNLFLLLILVDSCLMTPIQETFKLMVRCFFVACLNDLLVTTIFLGYHFVIYGSLILLSESIRKRTFRNNFFVNTFYVLLSLSLYELITNFVVNASLSLIEFSTLILINTLTWVLINFLYSWIQQMIAENKVHLYNTTLIKR
jgi:hypothetical protein